MHLSKHHRVPSRILRHFRRRDPAGLGQHPFGLVKGGLLKTDVGLKEYICVSSSTMKIIC